MATEESKGDNKLFSGPEALPNAKIEKVNIQALTVAQFPVKVVLLGDTGTGKSRLARYIYENSKWKECKTIRKEVWDGIKGTKLRMMLARTWAERTADDEKKEKYLQNGSVEKELIPDFEDTLKKHPNGVPLTGSGFFEINLAALPKETISGELFGYVRGAFTDADEHGSPGLFIQANGGTVFLDEIAACPKEVQEKLLTVIQPKRDKDGECPCYVKPDGQTETVRVNVRLICATNKDLEEEITADRFSEELFYRLRDYIIRLPSLRDLELVNPQQSIADLISAKGDFSKEDIEEMKLDALGTPSFVSNEEVWKPIKETFYLRWFVQKVLNEVNNMLANPNTNCKARSLASEARGKLLGFNFRGNYRELQSCLKQAWLNAYARVKLYGLKDDMLIEKDDIPNELKHKNIEVKSEDVTSGDCSHRHGISNKVGSLDKDDLSYLENQFTGLFTPTEAECISELLVQNVCSLQSLKAVINLPGFMRVDKCASMPKRDFSDIRSFIYLIGYMEQHNEITEEDAVKKVLGPKAKMGRFQRTLLPKFGICFRDLQFAFKGI